MVSRETPTYRFDRRLTTNIRPAVTVRGFPRAASDYHAVGVASSGAVSTRYRRLRSSRSTNRVGYLSHQSVTGNQQPEPVSFFCVQCGHETGNTPIGPTESRRKSRVHCVNSSFPCELSLDFMSLRANVPNQCRVAPLPLDPETRFVALDAFARTRKILDHNRSIPFVPIRRLDRSPRSRFDAVLATPGSLSVPALQPVRNVAVLKSVSIGVQLGVSIVIAICRSNRQRNPSTRQYGRRFSSNGWGWTGRSVPGGRD
ncbi:hypothetical protein SAMN04515672_4390 [Natronorubrum texcoconense]|uniref:Uncharacterized protein n=1 Tax=Natronorubrum texcoconense TaxID=1095776 RepID=A0A1G9G2E3_9EURY|nr:hypothetical protein SAMN04515672_4390 [Natronorubrum texcoconense]